MKFIFAALDLLFVLIGKGAEMVKWHCVDLNERDACDKITSICLGLCLICVAGIIIAPA